MKKTKWLSVLLAVFMVLSVFSACAKPTDTPSDPSQPSQPSQPGTQTEDPATPGTTESERPEGAAAEQVVKLFYSDEISDWTPLHPSSAGTWVQLQGHLAIRFLAQATILSP